MDLEIEQLIVPAAGIDPGNSFLPIKKKFGTTRVRSYDPGSRLPMRFRL